MVYLEAFALLFMPHLVTNQTPELSQGGETTGMIQVMYTARIACRLIAGRP
jgi:hypothetical protein